MNLNYKIIIVTGASGFIGQEICIQILKNGGNLIAVGKNRAKLNNLEILLKNGLKIFQFIQLIYKKPDL